MHSSSTPTASLAVLSCAAAAQPQLLHNPATIPQSDSSSSNPCAVGDCQLDSCVWLPAAMVH